MNCVPCLARISCGKTVLNTNDGGPDRLVVGITGADGFVGSELARRFRRDGHVVVAFSRRGDPSAGSRSFALEGDGPIDLDALDAVIHCAYDRTPSTVGFERNVNGTMRLHSASAAAKCVFVFVSSLSALENAASTYGRQKYRLEQLLAGRAVILRPGLVAANGGLIAGLLASIKRGIVPLIDGGRQIVQLVAPEDLYCAARWAIAERRAARYTLASEPPTTVGDLVRSLAQAIRRKPLVLDVPFAVAYAVASIAEFLRIPLPLKRENLRALRVSTYQAPDLIPNWSYATTAQALGTIPTSEHAR